MKNTSLIPIDDGQCDHLLGIEVPKLSLDSTEGPKIDVKDYCGSLGVIFFYPATGVPDRDPSIDPAPGWDFISGAAGCTAQSCAFRDLYADIRSFGANLIGISSQPLLEQIEFSKRKEIPFPLLSDEALNLTRKLNLPTFSVGNRVFIKRHTLIVRNGIVKKVFYPIYPTEQNAADVLQWLKSEC